METGIVQIADTDAQILKCKELILEFRNHLKEEEFLSRIQRQQQGGYHLVFIEEDGKGVSFAGFRINELLAWGKSLYIDDLSTLPAYRGKGYGGKLIDWVINFARTQHCEQVHLDSGVHRHDAHRLYLNKGFIISSHHFSIKDLSL